MAEIGEIVSGAVLAGPGLLIIIVRQLATSDE